MSKVRLSWLALFVAASALACVDSTATGVSTGPFYKIVPTIADSTAYPAGSIIVVRAAISHQGASVGGAVVAWTVLAGGGVVSAASSPADTLGTASVTWVLGDTIGINSLVIATADGADTLYVRAVVGAPSSLVTTVIDSVGMASGGTVTLQAKVTDRVGNVVPAATVKWTASGGSVSASSVATDASGLAAVTFSATSPGLYSVVAELPGLATHTYQILVR